MNIKIKVTKDILRRSAGCQTEVGYNCAIALAVRDITPSAWVGLLYITWCAGIESSMPLEATEFIRQFDAARSEDRPKLPEFSFEVYFPNELVELIGINEIKTILSISKTLELA